jgi:hypothetical protein
MMETIGRNRVAAILFEDGTLSENFPLETGRLQGDGPSPLQYNMGEEIVLLKIELDPNVASVFQHHILPRFLLNLEPDPMRRGDDINYNVHLGQESHRETDKVESFADDNSTATLATGESLGNLLKITKDFEKISGLKSNTEKTTLMQIGTYAALPENVIALGFNTVNETKLLGLIINRDLTSLRAHFETVIQNVARICEYWERFNLTLPGRIQVCKTFMLSQIGYLGSILNPSVEQINTLQNKMDKYCLGNLRIAKKKLYSPVSEGGLGLVSIRDFLTSLQCSWIKRITQHWGDNWRYDIKRNCYGNVLIADESTFIAADSPILYNICTSFGKFKNEFYKKDRNYCKAFVFKNKMFKRSRNDNGILCENFFGRNNSYETFCKIAKLKFEDFFELNTPKSLDNLNLEFGLNFTLVTYMRLHEAFQFFVVSKRIDQPAPSVSLEKFVKSFIKGSKPFRKILRHAENIKLDVSSLNTVVTFHRIIDENIFEKEILKKCWGMWNSRHYGNRCREFIFKFYNNILGINVRVNKFVPNHDPLCTFCLTNNEPAPIYGETFKHLFFECRHSGKYRNAVENTYFPELDNSELRAKKGFWFLGIMPSPEGFKNNSFIDVVVQHVNFSLWHMKLLKEMKPVSVFMEDLKNTIRKKLRLSKELRDAKTGDNFYICRHGFGGAGVQ